MTDNEPGFMQTFAVEAVGDRHITVRQAGTDHVWRYEVAEKNGRLQLLRVAHAPPDVDDHLALDAYDFATAEARQRGLVD